MTTNVSYALAIKLSTSASLSTEERLFRQALSQVEDKTSRGGVRPAIFDILQHAQSIEDLKYALDSVRRSNKFWTEDVGKTWLKNLSKYAEQILVYKGLLGSVTARIGADVASPIWGTFEFILSIFKDVASTVSKLENIERTLKASISRFSRYFTSNLCASSSVQGALVEYYEIVISFAVETHGEFQASRSRTVFNAVHRTLNAKLTDLSDKIQRAIDDVDKGARIDRDERSDRHMEILNGNLSLALAQYASGRSSPQPPATRTIQNLPNRTNHFSGRRDYLSTIWKAFQRQNNCQACTAVYGMPGIGKTQLIQKYAYDQFHGKFRRIIVYIDASSSASISSNVLTFMQSYAPDLLLNASNGEQHFSTFHAWLSNQDDWLLVLDNIRDYNDVQKLLPRGQQGQILCSTRERMLAEMLAHENTIEIMPMSKLESKTFIAKLTECSNISEDKTDSIHDLVADFAKGVPLYIEQIVHNAIFGHKSIRTTLSQVAEKTALLRQKNLSSLHEDNLSLGGMIMQAFETIKARSDKAEALFGILAYLQPSAIPLQLIREGSKEYQSFLTSSVTYNRGARRLVNGNPQISFDDRPPSLVKPESESKSKSSSRLRNWSSRLVRSKNATIETDLLVDDADLRKALSTDFGPNTPYGRLFENRDTIDSAILTLCNAAVIRHTDFETLWMHDLVSEVARALIESNSCVVGQQILRTSSIMVYLSLPHPESLYILNNLASSRKYLPHALVCHQEMKNAGILNDSSIGPELSHLIASILSKNLTRDFQVSGERCTQEERVFCDERILDFYTQAYHGYMAGWARLKSRYGISDKQIHHLTTKDRDAEVAFNMFFKGEEYSKETNRFGRAAPWRAIQTAARLYVHLEDNMQRYSEAQHWLQIVLDFCEMVFGPLDEETEYFRSCMTSLLGHYKGDYESAYNLNLVPVAKILQCKVSDLGFDRLQNVEFTPLLQTAHGLEYIDTAGSCALNQARKCRDKSDRASKLVWARVALFWLKIKLRETRAFYRDSLYVLSAEMKSHAYAYELWEKSRTSMYYFAQAIVCTFDTTGPLAEECGPAPSVKLDNIKLYKEAKIRLYGEAGLAGLAVWDDDPELKELIGLCDAKANAWKDSYQSSPSEVAEKEEAIDWSAILVQHSGLEDCASIEDRQEVELGEEKENVRPENI